MTATETLPPVVRRGEAGDGPFSLVITPENAGWGYSSLRILELAAGGSATFETGEDEMCVLPLAGGCVVECDGERVRDHRAGRRVHPGHRLRLRPAGRRGHRVLGRPAAGSRCPRPAPTGG